MDNNKIILLLLLINILLIFVFTSKRDIGLHYCKKSNIRRTNNKASGESCTEEEIYKLTSIANYYEPQITSLEQMKENIKDKDHWYVFAINGCNNKLLVLLAVSKLARQNGKTVSVVWSREGDSGRQCRGTFTDVFLPIEGLTVLSEQIPYKSYDMVLFHNHQLKPLGFVDTIYDIPDFCEDITPHKEIYEAVLSFIELHKLKKFASFHLRTTDFVVFEKGFHWNEELITRAVQETKDWGYEKLFLLTDTRINQNFLKEKFGDYVIFYQDLPEPHKGLLEQSYKTPRYTSFTVLAIEQLIASAAQHFIATEGSTTSQFVIVYHRCKTISSLIKDYDPTPIRDEKESFLQPIIDEHRAKTGLAIKPEDF